MKNRSLFSLLTLFGGCQYMLAQVPNTDFEAWTASAVPQPVGWTAMGWQGCFGPTQIYAQDSMPYTGVYNAKITTQYGGFSGQASAGVLFNGEMLPLPTCGNTFTGSPINYIPSYVGGFYTYALPQGGQDWGEVTVSILRGDTLLAYGAANLDTTAGNGYASFMVNIHADSLTPSITPDKMVVMFYTNSVYRYAMSPNPPCPYAELRVDGLWTASPPMERSTVQAGVSVSPNPISVGSAPTVFYSLSDGEMPVLGWCGTPSQGNGILPGGCYANGETATLEVVDLFGAIVWRQTLHATAGWTTLDAKLNAGMYICRLVHNTKTVQTTRFVVE